MSTGIKHTGIGLFIGVIAAFLLLTGMAFALQRAPAAPAPMIQPTKGITPSHTVTPTPHATFTYTPTPTYIIPATSTENVTPSPTPYIDLELLNSGKILITGPLSAHQQIELYKISLKYIAPTVSESIRLSKEINGVDYGHPSNICGPLAITIMREAGLINPDVDPYKFWLLNPFRREDRRILDAAFPAKLFSHTTVITPLNKVDWKTSPLQPGDFLYIKHGSWGNFDHMLVVNRVDSELRAYAVTNFYTADGYVIDEALLYDPNDHNAGLFHEWTKRDFAKSGSTGFGGFELWRLQTAK